ncbi:undecaprenyldiphospho-muramoylpentapeptide beta-N-acetylglucosaminyltransferase [Bacteroidales bacterium OttesenSCG-928-B11]|nr:undecaprenyldiphospho-muramoylpentapeptide beta-N-acetylglucosaminyltransferase [Bacteroidales bacterium OttesenSCG-928-E04]MDL2308932.1 undecaprenyldiphospho-muramoylpentapeptide beta-N-acetylglucosaminyltransferase [Bacteroidales bacterium OttesenSCG-928-C03]MDL2312703.1 undecaprenyldiphospho-muramoylpentapeptide beta-N-acetylglucosaminyltransferase [Bacteroidales bacterium OttesenSCG-928-B11]MDL2326263.1 undecaprenyldiphospho-muramoylpentapeptide beta-N-acetylglucosaminyltransferase [Bacte
MKRKFIISGGGTGGHIFPAIAIANKLKQLIPDAEILFIGANGKMEMKRVPEAGYPIEGLDIYGISRDFSPRGIARNLKLPFVLMNSMSKAKRIIRNFKPDVVIGVGGFASGPALRAAAALGIPTLIQEQNSFPGVTNKLLAKTVSKICVAYPGLEHYFPEEKIVLTGNPVRDIILNLKDKSPEAYQFFGLSPEKRTILVVGGSLGARTINECLASGIDDLAQTGTQLIWQTGELFYNTISQDLLDKQSETIKIMPFIREMDKAYEVADIIISRAGAIAISELTIVGKPTILVPFPYAAEDHQTKNAQALVDRNAAILISDHDATEKLLPSLYELINNPKQCNTLSQNIKKLAQPEAIDKIAEEILKL